MYILDFIVPGTWLDYEDNDWVWNIRTQIDSLRRYFFGATALLNLFVEEQQRHSYSLSFDSIESKMQHNYARRKQLELEKGYDIFSLSREELQRLDVEIGVQLAREAWAEGDAPREIKYDLASLYAREFIYTLDHFNQFLKVLEESPLVPPGVANARKKFLRNFPSLRQIRNSAHHPEDRSRNIGSDGKKMTLQPIVNDAIHAPGGGVLVLGLLNNSKYGATLGDGSFAEIDVSLESLEKMKEALVEVIESFKWKGAPSHAPSY